MNTTQQIITILLIAASTMATRALPFILFPSQKHTPRFVKFLGKYLASAVFGMLVVYCMKDISFLNSNHGVPQIIGIIFCVLLHLWRKNIFLTIAGGTIFYMAIIRIMPMIY